ncbi:unnamed protein product, partial [Scytosiphon promiscuus]
FLKVTTRATKRSASDGACTSRRDVVASHLRERAYEIGEMFRRGLHLRVSWSGRSPVPSRQPVAGKRNVQQYSHKKSEETFPGPTRRLYALYRPPSHTSLPTGLAPSI